ncbi:hypothetical protein CLJ1_3146 [Pseudomonas paraeruginosa]|nr:hypothetical protein CLJ1_3146 [Pseudomonas aeruginosa]
MIAPCPFAGAWRARVQGTSGGRPWPSDRRRTVPFPGTVGRPGSRTAHTGGPVAAE